ncbi:unnamed protein product, partial [Rotaria socialis]
MLALFLIRTADNRSMIMNNGGDPYLPDLQKYGNWKYVVKAFDYRATINNSFSNATIKSKRRIVLIGDSFAQDFYNMIIEGRHLL